ncbi:MAG: response regulator [Chloroflexi bacterium]|nr:response regulator [Chloroflexota bacterium]MBP7045113.1 response regulator [Chloroflexota bacterium]
MRRTVTILLVEDDKSMLFGMSDLLQVVDIDYEVMVKTAGNGQEALEVMERTTPDLIVSDIMMPLMDGFQFLTEVQKKPAWANIPFIFLTARGEKHEIHKGRLSGAALYITKPFQSMDLLELIKTQLDRKFQLEYTNEQHINNLKKNILQILNHEFRTPLTYVTAYYEMLADSVNTFADTNNFQEYLRGIQAGCVRLTRLIDSFIAVIELRTGEAQRHFLRQAECITDVDAIIQEAVSTVADKAARNHLAIQYAPAGNLPPIFGDRRSLLTVFQQILDNAIKFSSKRLSPTLGTVVEIHTAVTDTELAIAVQDHGVGLPRHMQNQVFDLFVQYNRDQLEQQGAGVGLTIANGLVKLHNGRIELKSKENVGSTFTVILPIYTNTQPQPTNGSRTPTTANILIVEDDQFLLEGLRELLEIYQGPYHLNTFIANNGKKGLDVLAEHTPDLIISDIMMPVMDGFTFLHEVRKNPEWVQIPFIFLTAKGERRDIHEGLRSGVEEYITKPYDSEELIGLAIKQLDRHFQMKRAISRNFDALKRSIVELITPDFRVPLASVTKYSGEFEQQITEARTDEDLKSSLQGIQNSSMRLSRLVEDFISLAELKTGEADMAYDLRVSDVSDIGFLLYETGQIYEQMAIQKGLTISCPLVSDLPTIQGDRATLINCIQRLLDMGLGYYHPSHTESPIKMMACTENREVDLSITFPFPLPADEAEAIDNYLLAKDLDNFDLPNGAPSLSIVNGYMNLHNGRLLFNHSSNHFTFSMVLPIKAATNTYFSP